MIIKKLSWLPAVIIMGLIFSFSAKPAEISGESSLEISRTIVKIYEQVTDIQIEGADRSRTLEQMDHIVRKTAHFMEYAALAAAIAFHFILSAGRSLSAEGNRSAEDNRSAEGADKAFRARRLGVSFLIASLYAATDEFHQTFVPGRSGQLSDVILDSCGAAAGVVFFALLLYIIDKVRNRPVHRIK